MTAIRVAHEGADYEVIVGSLANALPKLKALASGRKLPLVSDRRVFTLYGQMLGDVVLDPPILVPEGEAAKDWSSLASIIDGLAARGIKRGTPIVSLGGGSVGDVAALAASLFHRGCPVVHVPTTLLAQVDSAIGGKSAIDAAGVKNLVGSFHHPALVISDPAMLVTLDQRQLRSGYAEVAKYGLIDDARFFGWCQENGAKILAEDRAARRRAIEHCVRAKSRFVSADPADATGTRALLNLGHTFGHAIEAVRGHAVLHGEAVAIGISLAFAFSAELGLCGQDDALSVRNHFQSVGLPAEISAVGLNGPAILAVMHSDKKATATGLTLILARGIGQALVAKDVDPARLSAFLSRLP